ncbi:MAG: MFS transporter [Cetobacterium sp.]|uniref:MFS transporter n=1 Tax=Cetobacterium sp. TaxID=2071632 RepID=UPI003F383BA6
MKEKNNVSKVMPFIMMAFIFAGSLQEALNICAPIIAKDFSITSANVSLISSVAMLTMGVAYVFYTSLSDFISIKKLLITGIGIQVISSLGAFIFSNYFLAVLIFRSLQMAGGTSASALLILTATKYLPNDKHMKYYGFNTACFSGGQMLGILLGGIFATYIGWKYLFIIPAISIISIPFIIKYLPEDSKNQKNKVDILGISLMGTLALFISLYFSLMQTSILIICLLISIIFLLYISKNKNAFITIDFFKNWKYLLIILIVLITYSIQGCYSFLFSFMTSHIYGIEPSKISLILIPSYIISMTIGILGSKITKKIGVFKTLITGLGSMFLGLLIGTFLLDKNILPLIIMSCLFNGGFSILYTPIMTLIINSLPLKMRGTGLGFFNLCIKITSSTGIVITGKLLTINSLQDNVFITNISKNAIVYSNILLIFIGIVFTSFITVNIINKSLIKE